MSVFRGITDSSPALGTPVAQVSSASVIAHASANRPYILGSAVIGTISTRDGSKVKALVGAAASVKGVMCLPSPGVEQRGTFVKAGYDDNFNNAGFSGAFWCALDLANFDASEVEALTAEGVLSVDSNGVFSYGQTAPSNNTTVTNGVVLNYYDSAILSAMDESVSVDSTTYTFKYDSGIGGIMIAFK